MLYCLKVIKVHSCMIWRWSALTVNRRIQSKPRSHSEIDSMRNIFKQRPQTWFAGNPSSAHASQNSLGSKKSMIGESLNTVHLNRNKPIDSPFGSLVTHGSQISGFSSGQHQNGFSNGQLPATGVIPGEIYIENGVVSKVIAISPYSEPNTALSTYSGNGVKNLGSIDENTTTSGETFLWLKPVNLWKSQLRIHPLNLLLHWSFLALVCVTLLPW